MNNKHISPYPIPYSQFENNQEPDKETKEKTSLSLVTVGWLGLVVIALLLLNLVAAIWNL
jgi:hypothetical protein